MILFFHQAALGDFVLTFPWLRALQAQDAVTVVTSWSKALLAQKAIAGANVKPMSIELFEFTRLHAPGGPTALSPAVREVFEGVSLVISFVARADDPWAANVARLAPGAKLVFVEPRPTEASGWRGHIQEWHQHQLAGQGLEVVPVAPAERKGAAGSVVIQPGSGGRDKCWPIEDFERLIAALRAEGREVRPVLGEAELERWPAEVTGRWREELGAEALLDLTGLYDLLQAASLYVGNDSGPTHLAAQLGVPTVALFGPSDPKRWAPQGPHVTVLAPPKPRAMPWLSPDAVLAAVRQRLLP